MKSIPFNPITDLEPTPFSERQLVLAQKMKEYGLTWHPHVGCFVWDVAQKIKPRSPFPNHVYFILNMARFIDIFKSLEKMQEALVWLPTWHQARLICEQMGIKEEAIARLWYKYTTLKPGDETTALYQLLISALSGSRQP
jgi:hypothetical protein